METPALEMLIGTNMHQDWPDVHGTEAQPLKDFEAGEPQLAGQLRQEVTLVLQRCRSEEGIRDHVETFDPSIKAPGGTYREWLTRIAGPAD